MATTIADLVESKQPIQGVLVVFYTYFNKFTGSVRRLDAEGLVVAHGCDIFGPCNVKGPARGFELLEGHNQG
jgi:hypothetical protein